MPSFLQSSASDAGVMDSDIQSALSTAAAGGISPVLALVESGAADERLLSRHLADTLGSGPGSKPRAPAISSHARPLTSSTVV